MILARVEGNATSTRKHPSFSGWKMLLCQPISPAGEPGGPAVIAIDPQGAGIRDNVLISTDGKAARALVGDKKSPVRHFIVAIVDDLQKATSRNRGGGK